MDSLIIFAVVVVVFVLIVALAIGGKSIGAYLLPKDIESAAKKAADGAEIVDANVDARGRIEIKLSGIGGLSKMYVQRHGEITASVASRPSGLPKSGSFTFRTPEADLSEHPHITYEVLSHVRNLIANTLASKGFSIASGNQIPTLLVRYRLALDRSISENELNRLHGFVLEGEESDKSYQTGPEETVIKQGSLVIDISDGSNDLLLWRAAAIAEVSMDDNSHKKKTRREQAVQVMFKDFPP